MILGDPEVTYCGRVTIDVRLARTVRALADEHRRAILDALRVEDGRPVRELERVLPAIGRHAVLKHLRVLENAELVTTRKVGRSRFVQLNPTPIVELATRWLDDYAAFAGLALTRLLHRVESDPTRRPQGDTMPTTEPRTLIATIVIEATSARVWQALTDPEQTSRWFFGGLVRSDWNVGSPDRVGRCRRRVAHRW